MISLKLCVRRNNSDKLTTHGLLINLTQLKVLLNSESSNLIAYSCINIFYFLELREAKKLMNESNEW